MQIVIPMAGIGKRFIEAGYKNPKPFIQVDGKPMIQHVYELFSGQSHTWFICNEEHISNNDTIKILKKISNDTGTVFSIPNENRKGPVDAVLQIARYLPNDDEVIVSYCDFGTSWDYNSFLEESRKADGAIACYTGFHPHMLGSDNYAFVKMNGEYAVKVQEKKPFTNDRMSELASNGIYYFKSGKILKHYFQKLYDQNITVGGEFYVSEVYNLMIKDGLKVVCPLIKHMLQWGTPHDLEIYQKWSDCFHYEKQEEKAICPPNTSMIVSVAGHGTRFAKDGYTLPKAYLPIDGRPMYERAIECLPETNNKYIITRPEYKISDCYKPIVLNEIPPGFACACDTAIKEVDSELPILISCCDNGAKYNHKTWNELVNDEEIDIIVWTFTNNPTVLPNPDMYSYVKLSKTWKDNTIYCISTKKCPTDKPMKNHAIIGTFFFRKAKYFSEAFKQNYDRQIKTNNEYYVDDVLSRCLESGLRISIFEVDHYICWGMPDDYKTYNYWSEYFNGK